MIKILIYLNESELKPTGGARGYFYSLRQGIQNIDHENFQFEYLHTKHTTTELNSKIAKTTSSWMKSTISALKSIAKKGAMMYGPIHRAKVNLEGYDGVHFHTTMDMYWAKDSLKKYKGTVVLTLHAPTMPSKQMFSMLTIFEKKYMKWFYSNLSKIDDYAIRRADKIIVACEDAEEPYYHEWPGYQDFHNSNKDKYLYMATGTSQQKALLDKDEIRKKYGIPKGAFVITYVGRHNEIKGYDSLKRMGSSVLGKYDNVYFLIAGTEGPLYHLNDRRWIEVGWTNDPASIITSSDLFVLPNKETYFDLIMLEVLSLGQIVLASRTGGNKYFEKYNAPGIRLYENESEALRIIENLYKKNSKEIEQYRLDNKSIYEHEFTNDAFAKRYLDTLNIIFNGTKNSYDK